MWGASTTEIASLVATNKRVEATLNNIAADLGIIKTSVAVTNRDITDFRERLRELEKDRRQPPTP